MPRSDTWPCGHAGDPQEEMDSTGSCDSVVSFNSCFSDDSLEYLSAEEKACLMFLEETIHSLDTEDDSGVSNDESYQLPARGNVATKAAHLSAAIGHRKLTAQDVPKRHFEDTLVSGSPVQNETLNYMVPTPFVLANCNSQILTKSGQGTTYNKEPPKMVKMVSVNDQEASHVPSEVNVVVIPPPYEIKSNKGEEKQNEQKPKNVSPRGPLSYEDLVQLRKSAPVQKNVASQAITGEEVSATTSLHRSNEKSTKVSQTLTQNLQLMESRSPKPPPPPVAPKPKMRPLHKAQINQEGSKGSGGVPVDKLMNPEKVRLEALCKLGLLKREDSNKKQFIIQGQRSRATSLQNQTTGENLPTCVTTKPGELMNQPVQSCSPVHQRSMSDLCTAPSRPDYTVRKAATLERTGMGGQSITFNHGSSSSNTIDFNTVSQNHQSCSPTVEVSESTDRKPQGSVQASSSYSKSPHVKSLNVMVPSTGENRREALRKLGLLKN